MVARVWRGEGGVTRYGTEHCAYTVESPLRGLAVSKCPQRADVWDDMQGGWCHIADTSASACFPNTEGQYTRTCQHTFNHNRQLRYARLSALDGQPRGLVDLRSSQLEFAQIMFSSSQLQFQSIAVALHRGAITELQTIGLHPNVPADAGCMSRRCGSMRGRSHAPQWVTSYL